MVSIKVKVLPVPVSINTSSDSVGVAVLATSTLPAVIWLAERTAWILARICSQASAGLKKGLA